METTKSYFQAQTVARTTQPARQWLADIAETYGTIPSVLAVMANSALALESYQRLCVLFSLSEFTPLEVHGVYLTIIREEGSSDLAREHSSLLNGWLGVPESVIEAIRSGEPTGDEKLDVLLKTTRQLVQGKGALSAEMKKRFIAAGYRDSQLIDLLVPVVLKTMTSYLERINKDEN